MERQPEQPAKSPSTHSSIFHLYASRAAAATMNYPWFLPTHPSLLAANFNGGSFPRPYLPPTGDFWRDLYSNQFLPQAYPVPTSSSASHYDSEPVQEESLPIKKAKVEDSSVKSSSSSSESSSSNEEEENEQEHYHEHEHDNDNENEHYQDSDHEHEIENDQEQENKDHLLQEQQQIQHKKQYQQQQKNSHKPQNSSAKSVSDFELPFSYGWKRRTKIKAINSRGIVGDVTYVTPCAKNLRAMPDIGRYLQKHANGQLTKSNFTFSSRVKVGEFYDCREPNTESINRLTAEELKILLESISKKKKSSMRTADKQRKLEEKKILKMQKIEKQREQRELRAQQILQEKARRKEQMHAEALRKAQEKEQRRQKILLMKEKERERKRNCTLCCRALEARKKLEEKERLKIEKSEEHSKEIPRYVDDLTLKDSKPLPDFERVDEGFTAESFSCLLQVFEFIHTYADTLGLESLPSFCNLKDIVTKTNTCHPCIVHLVNFAKVDPGVPESAKINNIDVDESNVFEILQKVLDSRLNSSSPFHNTSNWTCLNVEEKSRVLARLMDELLVSRVLMAEIDRSVEDVLMARQNVILSNARLKTLKNGALKHTAESDRGSDSDSDGSEDENNAKMKWMRACRRVRGLDLGQDRYFRKYWILSSAGGIFIEGIDTAEPDLSSSFSRDSSKAAMGCVTSTKSLSPGELTSKFFDTLQNLFPNTDNTTEIRNWFSLLPRSSCQKVTDSSDSSDDEQPLPLTDNVRNGWWRIEDGSKLQELMSSLNEKGVREHGLYTNLKTFEREASASLERSTAVLRGKLSSKLPKHNTLKREILVLEEVEAFEEKICSSSLQVKGWQWPPKLSTSPFLVPLGSPLTPRKRYALDVARERLLALEANLEKRYLLPPLGTVAQDGEIPDGDSSALKAWRSSVSCARSVSALGVCIKELRDCVAWHKSIMRVSCQLCMKDEDEANLLLCDCCDKGFHTYCFIPPLESIPENDWFCHHCRAASKHLPKVCIACGKSEPKLVSCHICSRAIHVTCIRPSVTRLPRSWVCLPCEQKRSTESEDKPRPRTAAAKNRLSRSTDLLDNIALSEELDICRIVLQELENHNDAWPFTKPVNTSQFPQYKQVIKKPMDLSTMKSKLCQGLYANRNAFLCDVRLMFRNCKIFNEDESDVGQAGINLARFFKRTWKQLTNTSFS